MIRACPDTLKSGGGGATNPQSVLIRSSQTIIRRMAAPRKQVPNGGWGWAIVLGAALANIFNQSLISLFGLIFGGHLEDMGHGTVGVALVMNVSSMVTNFSGLITGPILKKYSPRAVTITGVIFSAFGMIAASFATSLLQVIMTYAIFTGLGLGLIMPATFVAVSNYFNTRKQVAVSLSMVGTSVGQIAMPHVVSVLLSEFGYRGTTLIMGALCLNGLVGALLFHPVRWHMKPSVVDKAESKGLLSKEKIITQEKIIRVVDEGQKSARRKERPLGVWGHVAKTLDLGLLKDLVFLHITSGIALVYTCSIAFSMVFPFFLQHTIGLDRERTAICMSFLAGADILARLVVPLLGAHFSLSNRVTFLLGAGVLSLCRTFLILQSSFELVALGAFMCGFARAATVVYQNLTVSEYVQDDKIPSAVGLNMVTKALFVLSIGQFFGWVRDATESFPMCIFAQNVVLVAVSLSWSLEIVVRWLRRKENELLQVAGNF